MVKWDVPIGAESHMLTAIATSLGEIPKHKYPERPNTLLIYLNEDQVDRLIKAAEAVGPNVGTEVFIRECKYLKTSSPDKNLNISPADLLEIHKWWPK